jgi:hypothetical protein
MVKKPVSIVLTSKASSTYTRGYACGASSAAALLNGLFEHPAELVLFCHMKINEHLDDETG